MRESLTLAVLVAAFQAGALDPDRKAEFLRNAEVVKAVAAGSGVTDSFRLTLKDGELTHDAHFQSVNERALRKDVGAEFELGFVDSYRYNVAAYRLARLIGLEDMVPVSVEREWKSRKGAMTWWVDDVWMDEGRRAEKDVRPPDGARWSRQSEKIRLFSELIYDTDRNLSNVLITRDWEVWMIDFTRAFRPRAELRSPEELLRCDRRVYEKLVALSREQLTASFGDLLNTREIEGILARRDLLLAHYEQRIRERGESAILY
jgi:hypothetical protein